MTTLAKPDYRLPTMAEIAAVEKNGLVAVSTFSGCGGSTLGLRWAGYSVLFANEFVPEAHKVYVANHPTPIVSDRDIRTLGAPEIRKALDVAGLLPTSAEIDLLEGSPPCDSFSLAGKRSAGWQQEHDYSGTKQRTDDLFFEFVRLLDGLRPRAFVAENVAGLIRGVAIGYFERVKAAMSACGYRVESKLVDASWLGVPQKRERVFFVGVREDLGRDPVFPSPLPYRRTLRDALPELAAIRTWKRVVGPDEPAPTVQTHGRRYTHSEFLAIDDERVGLPLDETTAVGRESKKLRPGQWSRKYGQLGRPKLDAPSPTITAGGGKNRASVIHPDATRKFSIEELRRICGFPDDFELSGTYAQKWERLGRSVPPPVMRAIAETLAKEVLL